MRERAGPSSRTERSGWRISRRSRAGGCRRWASRASRRGSECTHSDPHRFFSHRRDGRTGRQATLIWIR
ncbi:MAG: laccase domain-containing protein [Steroidobacteraceae bacterium]